MSRSPLSAGADAGGDGLSSAGDVWHLMQPVRGQIRLAMCLSALGTLSGLASLALLALVVHALLREPQAWPWLPMSGAIACGVVSYLLRLNAFNQSHYAAFRLETVLRARLAAHLAQLPLGEVYRHGAGALSKVMQDDVKALHVFVADSTPLRARAQVAPVMTALALLWLDWRLALAAMVVLLTGMAVLMLATRNAADMGRQYHEARERVSAAIIEFVQAMPVVRTFDSGHVAFGRFQRALDAYYGVLTRWYHEAGFPARFSFAILGPLPTLLVLLWLGCWLITGDRLAPDTWVAVLLLGTGMAESVMPMMMLRHMVARAMLSAARIREIMALPVQPQPAQGRLPADAGITFDQVGFSYRTGHGEPALRDVSFRVPPGTVTALVGPSGAGKSTVARLIPRFWDVDDGCVLLGGVDVRDIRADVLMQQVAFVFQDTFLFADTIANNIRLGLPQATMDEVRAAAIAAQAHEFISALPHGYDTPAGERGVRLSGGQCQRITIARAILQNRPILVLDEATAFADPENEAALVVALSALMRGKTVLMVAHRLPTICDADQILVFDRGTLAESGSHAALMAQDGVYTRLWRHYWRARQWTLPASPLAFPAGMTGETLS